jgi:Na+-translocating ferredoxin:NAD+ oxidoreductase RnfD subunit
VWLVLSLLLAYAVSLRHIEWFFPAVMLIIGGRYTVFHTLYGPKIYWPFGIFLALAALMLAFFRAPPGVSASVGALIELGFGIYFLVSHRRRPQSELSR